MLHHDVNKVSASEASPEPGPCPGEDEQPSAFTTSFNYQTIILRRFQPGSYPTSASAADDVRATAVPSAAGLPRGRPGEVCAGVPADDPTRPATRHQTSVRYIVVIVFNIVNQIGHQYGIDKQFTLADVALVIRSVMHHCRLFFQM